MKRYLVRGCSFILLMLCFLFRQGVYAQSAASVVWNLTADANVSSIAGSISAGAQSLSNLQVQNYSTNNAQRTSPDGAGTWPGDAAEVSDRYMQFKVGPSGSNTFAVGSVSLYLWVNSGSNMRANVYFSEDSTFSTKTQIGTTFTLSSTEPGSPNVTASPDDTVGAGGSFYLRVYPWYTTSTTSKHVLAKIVTVSGTTSPAGNYISTSAPSLPAFVHTLGTPSSSQSYTVSGTTLANDVIVTPPTGFEISTDGGSVWRGPSWPDTLQVSGGVITGQPVTVLVRLNGASADQYFGAIAHKSLSASQVDVTVSGTTLAGEPTTQSALSFGTVSTTSIDVNFSGGNGSNRLLVVRQASSVSWVPTDGTPATGVNSDYAAANDQGSGNKVVYDGSGSSVAVTGLSPNASYYFAVYEYNIGSGNSENYLTDSPGTGDTMTAATTAILASPSSLSFGSQEVNTISGEQTYTLSGLLLTPSDGNITVTAPSGFEVSISSGSGFGDSVQVAYTGGELGSTTIYVRFAPTVVQSYNASISNTGGGAPPEEVTISGNAVAPGAANEFQAEDCILTSAYVRSDYAGYTGTGYVDIANKTGAALDVLFRRTSAASDTVRVYYALGASSRAYAVSLNGVSLGTLSFTGTGSWTTWSSVYMIIGLQAGVNDLKFAATTNTSENANIDRIVVGGQTATAVYKLTLAASGPGTVIASPPSADSLYDVGTEVTLTASPTGGNILLHWSGTDQSTSNPFILTMDAHKTEIGVITGPGGFGAFPYQEGADGFAAVGALGYPDGTTGGVGPGAQMVYVTNYADFADAMFKRSDPTHVLNFPPLIVYVIGTITGSDMLDVKDLYDVSIIGVGVDAKLSGFGLNIVRSRNVIVRNLYVENSVIDGFTIQANDVEGTGDHLWVDHCTVTNCYDGAIDVTHTESYVTVSWNHMFHHDKTCLMGHSDSQTSDVDMKVTYHHDYFDSTVQRHPRVRFGKAHVYNNYYRKNVLYGVSSNLEADVVVEGSYFLDVPIPTETSRDGSPPGDLVERYNIFAGTTGVPGTRGTAFDPSVYYNYSLDSASTIPALLTAYAGSGKYDFSYRTTGATTYSLLVNASHGTVTKNPAQASYDSGATVELTATPSTGYHFTGWTGDLAGSSNPENILMDGNKTVTANFAINQYTITATAGPNGSITPSGSVIVNYGDSAQFSLIPLAGYHVDSLLIDESNAGSLLVYTFHGVQGNHTIRAVFAEDSPTIAADITLLGGWNLVSVPVRVDDPLGTSLFPSSTSSAFAYEGSYVPKETLLLGQGYWVKVPDPGIVSVNGLPYDADSFAVSIGWNMIGSLSGKVPVGGIGSVPPSIVTSSFFGYNGSYFVTDTISPGEGYWVKAATAGKLILSTTGTAPSNRIRIALMDENPPPPPSGMRGEEAVPTSYALAQNHPNPFNPTTIIAFDLPQSGVVSLSVFNVLGNEVALLLSGAPLAGGRHAVSFDGSTLASGVYFYRLSVRASIPQSGSEASTSAGAGETFTSVKKMLLMK